jgi:nicotinamide phosphoribosyltransferase
MTAHGWSADNVAFGSGGGLLQKLNRDTLRFAFKCSYIEGEDFSRGVHKNPVTDTGKASKSGRLRLVKPSGGYQTVNAESYEALQHEDCLKEVYRNGDILVTHTFDDIRARAAI